MNKATELMFERGILVNKYKDIIEIYPHKVTNSKAFDVALSEIEKDHELYQMFPGWIRAFKKHTQTHENALLRGVGVSLV